MRCVHHVGPRSDVNFLVEVRPWDGPRRALANDYVAEPSVGMHFVGHFCDLSAYRQAARQDD